MGEASLVLALFAGVAGSSIAGAAVFIVARRRRPTARRGAAHAASALGALASAAILLPALEVPLSWILPGLVLVACHSYIGFHLDNMAETARRIRILRELHASGGLARSDILSAYPPQEVFDRRVRRLILAGQCIEENGRLRIAGGAYSRMGALVALGRRLVFGAERGGSRDNL